MRLEQTAVMAQHLRRKLAVCQAGSEVHDNYLSFEQIEVRAIADVNGLFFLSSKREHGFGIFCAPPPSPQNLNCERPFLSPYGRS